VKRVKLPLNQRYRRNEIITVGKTAQSLRRHASETAPDPLHGRAGSSELIPQQKPATLHWQTEARHPVSESAAPHPVRDEQAGRSHRQKSNSCFSVIQKSRSQTSLERTQKRVGYDGGYSSPRNEFGISEKTPWKQLTVRFETRTGVQAQMDWALTSLNFSMWKDVAASICSVTSSVISRTSNTIH